MPGKEVRQGGVGGYIPGEDRVFVGGYGGGAPCRMELRFGRAYERVTVNMSFIFVVVSL